MILIVIMIFIIILYTNSTGPCHHGGQGRPQTTFNIINALVILHYTAPYSTILY